jgi:hypothetical protein
MISLDQQAVQLIRVGVCEISSVVEHFSFSFFNK